METTNQNNIATFIHLSTLSQYFFPLGNYIFPVMIWTSKKDKSPFIDFHGKQALNFQLSMLIYTLVLALIAIPIFIGTIFNTLPHDVLLNDSEFVMNNFNIQNSIGIITVGVIAAFIFLCLKISEFFFIIYASIKASNGEEYKYPLTITFIK